MQREPLFDRVAGVVLAAGLSSRMGTNKLLLDVGGKSLLRRAVDTAIDARLDPVVVVVGNEQERAVRELQGIACAPVFNPDYALGMDTSLRAGARAVPDDAAAFVVMLADMPLVTAGMVAALVEGWRARRTAVAVSTYAGVLAPPTLYAQTLFAGLRQVSAPGDGRSIVERHRAGAVELAWPAPALADVDVPGDLMRLRARFEDDPVSNG